MKYIGINLTKYVQDLYEGASLVVNARDTSSVPGMGRFHMPQGN